VPARVATYAAASISRSTAASYASALTQWRDFCAESVDAAHAGPDPAEALGDVGPEQAADFFAWLADSASVTAGTIAGYRSGMRHHWLRQTGWADASNPFSSHLVDATLRGIARVLAPADRAARAARTVTAALEPRQVARLAAVMLPAGNAPASDEQAMTWAAALIGSYGLLRPNEFLGSYQHQDRHLRASQLEFCIERGTPAPVPIALTQADCPSLVRVRLGATKADQAGANAPLVIRARAAVEALWRWSRRRLAYSAATQAGPLFRVEGQRPLSIRALLDRLQTAMRAVDPAWDGRLTGRCFRRGGASELVRDGASLEEIQQAGRWLSPAMVYTYSDVGAVQARAASASAGTAAPLAPPTRRA
jgi:hypothetical protein